MGPLAPLLVERAEEVLPVDRAVAGLGVEGRALQRCCHLPKSAILRTSDHLQSPDSFRYKMATDLTSTTGEKFERLVGIMARLRAPGGCPWDREQSFDTIKPYLLEETYEVLDAIDARDWTGLADELGDLLLQAVFFAQMASEENRFDIGDSLDAISEKLIRL